MGCWSETCGLSNLPIPFETPCLLFVLAEMEKDRNAGGFSYPTGSWKPIALPLYGTYNDYGTLDLDPEANEIFTPWVLDRLRDAGMEGGSISKFLKEIERGQVKSPRRLSQVPAEVRIGQMIVRQDVWDLLLSVKEDSKWSEIDNINHMVAEGKLPATNLECLALVDTLLSQGDQQALIKEGLRDEAEGWVDDLLKLKAELTEDHPKVFSLIMQFHMDQEYRERGRSSVRSALYPCGNEPSVVSRTPLDARVLGWHDHQAISREEAITILAAAGEVTHVDSLMQNLRRAWRPQPGKGSQTLERWAPTFVGLPQKGVTADPRCRSSSSILFGPPKVT